jgi:AraC-like DNA-binding protein
MAAGLPSAVPPQPLFCYERTGPALCLCCRMNNVSGKFHVHRLLNAGHAKLVDKTCEYLLKNLDKNLSLREIALEIGSNRSKLASAFKQITSYSVFEWLRIQRMSKARDLLIGTASGIANIALEVGYDNSANFSTAYRAFFGIAPSEERKAHSTAAWHAELKQGRRQKRT